MYLCSCFKQYCKNEFVTRSRILIDILVLKCIFPIFQQHSCLSLFGWRFQLSTTSIGLPKMTRKKKQKQIKQHMHCLLTYIILDLAQFASFSISPWQRTSLPQFLYVMYQLTSMLFLQSPVVLLDGAVFTVRGQPDLVGHWVGQMSAVLWPARIITINLE